MFDNCKTCIPPKRHPGCHDKCPDYIKDKKEHEEFKNKVWEEKRKVGDVSTYKKEAVSKARNRNFKKNKK